METDGAGFPMHERLPDTAYARLFEQRVVFLRGTIQDSVADDVAAQLLALDARSEEDITMVIDSPGGISGQAKDIEIQAREIAYLRQRLEEILAERTKQPIAKIRADTDRDYWLTAEAAKEYGVIDEVLAERTGL